MEMAHTHKLAIFILVSICLHMIAAITISNPLNSKNKIFITPLDNYQPLQISMHGAAKNKSGDTLANTRPEKASRQATYPAKNTVPHRKINSEPESPALKKLINNTLTVDATSAIQTTRTQATMTDNIKSAKVSHTKEAHSLDNKNLIQKNAAIHEKLHALVEKNFSYPRFAVKRGWEGTVELGMRIEANGRLSNVHIVKTSGYTILDKAALSTLTETNYIKGLEAWLAGNYFDTTLPVKYELVGG